jgi:hypothetical protein
LRNKVTYFKNKVNNGLSTVDAQINTE